MKNRAFCHKFTLRLKGIALLALYPKCLFRDSFLFYFILYFNIFITLLNYLIVEVRTVFYLVYLYSSF